MAAAAILKNRKSPYLGNASTDLAKFGMATQFDPLEAADRWKFEILEIQDGGVDA